MLRLKRVRYHCMQLRCTLAVRPHYLMKQRNLYCVAPRSSPTRLTRNTSRQVFLQQQPHLVRSIHSQTLPWSEVLPYRSVRVDLVHATAIGWALNRIEDFSPLLQSKSVCLAGQVGWERTSGVGWGLCRTIVTAAKLNSPLKVLLILLLSIFNVQYCTIKMVQFPESGLFIYA